MKFDIKILFFVVSAVSVSSQTIRGATMERSLDSVCTNDTPFAGLDQGCSPALPLCARSDGYEPAADVAGDYCRKCRNVWDTDTVADWGCTESAPACAAELGKIGMRCVPADVPKPVCKNSGAFDAKDQDCGDETPICYNVDTQQEVGSYAPGIGCAQCLNSFENAYHQYGWSDYGCPKEQPRCAMADGSDPTLNRVGSKCCPADGCPITCPCNTPNTFLSYIATNLDVSRLDDYVCIYDYEPGVRYNNAVYFNDGSVGYSVVFQLEPDLWLCASVSSTFEHNEQIGFSKEGGEACIDLIEDITARAGTQCYLW